jgi:hypothetical protein
MNLNLLAKLRLLGFICIPAPPNEERAQAKKDRRI